jgi:hypothetical protein
MIAHRFNGGWAWKRESSLSGTAQDFVFEFAPPSPKKLARQGGTRLAQDVSPGWAGYMNPEPASAGDTIPRRDSARDSIVRSHPVRKSSGQGWGTQLPYNRIHRKDA